MNLQASEASRAKILQSQNRRRAEIRLLLNDFRVVHGRLKRYCQVENGEQQRAADTELAMDTPIAQDNA